MSHEDPPSRQKKLNFELFSPELSTNLTQIAQVVWQSWSYYARNPDKAQESWDEGMRLQAGHLAQLQQIWLQSSEALSRGVGEGESITDSDRTWRESLKVGQTIDRRFRHSAWQSHPFFFQVKQQYLNAERWIMQSMEAVEGTVEEKQRRLFFTRLLLEAISPHNFFLTNPDAIDEAQKTRGQSVVRGLNRFLDDWNKDDQVMSMPMASEEAFEVGENIACTPGHVVWRGPLCELLQYSAVTDEVRQDPIMIVPPWINKYYILDLSERNSLVRWLTEQGFTVFVLSWINPNDQHRDVTLSDYLHDGVLASLRQVRQRCSGGGKIRGVHTVGYCVGGTMLAMTLSYLSSPDAPVKKTKGLPAILSSTFLTTLTDFAECGDMRVFLSAEHMQQVRRKIHDQGYLDGGDMALTFALLRSRDLVWSFANDRYMMGKDMAPFDIMYWNSDSMGLAGAAHLEYLENMYQHNRLITPGAYRIGGVGVDLGRIEIPLFMVSTSEDHIAPWRSTFILRRIVQSPVTFVLGESGHVAGIVNPPGRIKYGFFENDSASAEVSADEWLAGARRTETSWWLRWLAWLNERSQDVVPSRYRDSGLDALGLAPGAYVRSHGGEDSPPL